jgi:hypothetical protein
VFLLQNAVLHDAGVQKGQGREDKSLMLGTLGDVPSKAKEERLSSELQSPDTDFLYTAFADRTVV